MNFEGHEGRECGEHRTTGCRAWCHDCTEWCYPEGPCKGCELPQLRAQRKLVLDLCAGQRALGCTAVDIEDITLALGGPE